LTTTQLIALLSSPLAPVVIGLIGSLVEKVGLKLELARVVAFGKMLEAVAADLPKLLSNVVALAKGEPKDPPKSPPADSPPVAAKEVFPQDMSGSPLEMRSLTDNMALAISMVAMAIATCLLLTSCAPVPQTIAKPEPCSIVALSTIMAGCEARIRVECHDGDDTCKTYQECRLAIKNWRACGGDQ
jgi:hypothetical protein